MTQRNKQISTLANCDQVVVYGANGWMGRSALDFLISNLPNFSSQSVLLIGSKPGNIQINGQPFEILDPSAGFSAIRENAIFFNAAFLRRENLQRMSPQQYLLRNQEIVEIAKNAIWHKKPFSFINLSSGAARDFDKQNNQQASDEYSRLKKSLEVEYSEIGNQTGVPIVNCRIFSLSGRYLNEFENLALSSFVNQARSKNYIEVLSPGTRRTYVDGTDLAGVLLSAGSVGNNANFDSGGILVSMLELAEKVAEVLDVTSLKIIPGKGEPSDYFGEYEEFNHFAEKFGYSIRGIEDQIQTTLEAFN